MTAAVILKPPNIQLPTNTWVFVTPWWKGKHDSIYDC